MRNSGIPALALAAVLCLAGLLASFSHGLTAKADTFWFYLIGYQLFDGGGADKVLDGVLGAIAEQPQEPDLKFEVEFRKNTAGNYPLTAVLSYGATWLVPWIVNVDGDDDVDRNRSGLEISERETTESSTRNQV